MSGRLALVVMTRRLPRWTRILLLLSPALFVVGVFFVAGVVQGAAQSFGYQPFLPGYRLSLNAYRQLWTDPAVRASLLLTARVAVLSTLLATFLGVTAALLIRRLGRTRGVVTGLLQANLAVPHLVGALAILLLLSQGGLLARLTHAAGLTAGPATFPALTADRFGWGIIAEYVWKETPFLAVIALAALSRGIDDLEGVARTLGASRWQRLRHLTLPLLAAPVAAGSILVFAFAAGSYEVPYLLGRPYPATLPVVAYQGYRNTDLMARPEAMAVAVLITVLTVSVVAGYLTLVTRLSRQTT
jgi:putative spermidine/putrescine transport system permease protein